MKKYILSLLSIIILCSYHSSTREFNARSNAPLTSYFYYIDFYPGTDSLKYHSYEVIDTFARVYPLVCNKDFFLLLVPVKSVNENYTEILMEKRVRKFRMELEKRTKIKKIRNLKVEENVEKFERQSFLTVNGFRLYAVSRKGITHYRCPRCKHCKD